MVQFTQSEYKHYGYYIPYLLLIPRIRIQCKENTSDVFFSHSKNVETRRINCKYKLNILSLSAF